MRVGRVIKLSQKEAKTKAMLFKNKSHFGRGRPLNEASKKVGIHCFHNARAPEQWVSLQFWFCCGWWEGVLLKHFFFFFFPAGRVLAAKVDYPYSTQSRTSRSA